MTISADQRVLGYLGRALSLELSAVQLYSTQAKIVETWCFPEIAQKLAEKADLKMQNANRLISRMLALGVAPNASQLRPVLLGQTVHEVLKNNLAFESEIIAFYKSATNHCLSVGDQDSQLFFQGLYNNEQKQAVELSRWLQAFMQPEVT